MTEAPGRPGIRPRWTSSAKSGIGTALSDTSRVWFTLSHGILNEVYYPRVDQACIRDLGLIVTDGASFFAEVKRDCDVVVEALEDGVPAFRLTSMHRGGRFRIVKRVIADPRSCSVLMQVRLEDLAGARLRLFALARRPISSTAAPTTAAGGATTKAAACCLPMAIKPTWPWPQISLSPPVRSASSAPRTAGSSFRAIEC
jgi:glucoamylase